jgi:hypothetical protein
VSQIKATVIAHSKSAVNEKEIITFELEFPRLILAEFNTHNALSKNASSSRAIPVAKMLEQVRNNPAMPVRFGKKNKGMQDAGEHGGVVTEYSYYEACFVDYTAKEAWEEAAKSAASWAQAFDDAGYAKQICNRLIEPFQIMKVVMTATELNNFIWLRDHPAADPTIEVLAKAIKVAKEASTPFLLHPGEWHLPYVGRTRDCMGNIMYLTGSLPEYSDKTQVIPTCNLEDALAISASCCAQVSFRSLDDSIEKAYSVVQKLNLGGVDNEPVHASPLEHQATPMKVVNDEPACGGNCMGKFGVEWEDGVTHMDRDGTLCSGNLKGFIQYRQLIPNNVKRG